MLSLDERLENESQHITVARLFIAYLENRLSINKPVSIVTELMRDLSVKFKDVTLEMFFKAEIGDYGQYYNSDDFIALCHKCMDFPPLVKRLIISDKNTIPARKIFPKTYRSGISY